MLLKIIYSQVHLLLTIRDYPLSATKLGYYPVSGILVTDTGPTSNRYWKDVNVGMYRMGGRVPPRKVKFCCGLGSYRVSVGLRSGAYHTVLKRKTNQGAV